MKIGMLIHLALTMDSSKEAIDLTGFQCTPMRARGAIKRRKIFKT